MALSGRGSGRETAEPIFPAASRSAGLSDFLARLRQRQKPRLYHTAPAPGGNIVLFAQVGVVVSVDADQDHRISGTAPEPLDFEDATLDAAIIWDVIDFLPRGKAEPFVADLTRAMKPGGLVFMVSSSAPANGPMPLQSYTIEEGPCIVARPVSGAFASPIARENREIIRLFDRFENVSLHLLRSRMREILLKRR